MKSAGPRAWNEYRSLLPELLPRFALPLRNDLESSVICPLGIHYRLNAPILTFLGSWMRRSGERNFYCFVTEVSNDGRPYDFELSLEDLSPEALEVIPSRTERIYVGSSFEWGIHVSHEGVLSAVGSREFLAGLVKAADCQS